MLSSFQGKYISNAKGNMRPSPRPSPKLGVNTGSALENIGTEPGKAVEVAPPQTVKERPRAANETTPIQNQSDSNNSIVPAAK